VSESANQLKFNPMAGTMMACPFDNAERQVLSSFQETDRYELKGDTLRFINAEKGTIATLVLSSETIE
jgi:heat shock protein HslJ